MSWEQVTIGGVALRESQVAQMDGDALSLFGREMNTITADAAVIAAHRNIPQLSGLTVPVVFDGKAHLSGFYRVDSASSNLRRISAGELLIAEWSVGLTRLGSHRDVEFESQVPTIARTSEVGGTASFWHAPPVGFTSYFTGATVPAASTTRNSADGAMTVYRGIPVDVAPRWTVSAADYLKGSARLAFDGIRHVGLTTPPHAAWELSNALVQVVSDGPGIVVSAYVGGAWKSAKGFRFAVAGVELTGTPEATVLRADPEECVLRLSWAVAPGRVAVDLALRRGARFVTGVMKRHSAATLGVRRSPAEAASTLTGGLRATNADADGNRYVIGSSRTVTADTTVGGLTRATSTVFDFFLGHEATAAPAPGGTFADLFAQYLGTASEKVKPLRR